MQHVYFGIENLNLNAAQRETLVSTLRKLGPSSHLSPACLCHWRIRLDGQAAIFEALFDDVTISVDAFTNRLAIIFGVAPATITNSIQIQHFAKGNSPVVTFIRNATNYLRVCLFGGVGASWEMSHLECLGYLKLNQAQWE